MSTQNEDVICFSPTKYSKGALNIFYQFTLTSEKTRKTLDFAAVRVKNDYFQVNAPLNFVYK